MNRAEHLQWAKDRALAYVAAGDNTQAFASMVSDLNKHPELARFHATTNEIGMQQMMAGLLNTHGAMRRWIQGYN